MNTTVETPASDAPPKSRWKLWIIGFLLLGAGGYAVYRFGTGAPADSSLQQQGRGGGPGFGGPGGRGGPGGFGGGGGFGRGQVVPVRVVPASKQSLDVYLRALGTVTPINTVTVRTRLDGELVKVNFTEGQRVAKGQVLAEIDTRPYQVQLAQAQGALEENRARLRNAQTDLERYQKLQQEQLITAQQVVGQEAQVGQLNGAIQSSEAQVASARLNLNYARIVAPIDGRLGLRQVDAGNMVRSGDQNGIVVITQMRPISVIFTVPETDLPPVLEALRANRKLSVEAWDRADALKLATGALQTVDNQIDTATGTIKLRATFENADESLFPNQFVNIRLKVRTLEDATVIPAAAVQRAAFGEFVYVVKPPAAAGEAPSVSIQRVTLGPTEGDRVAVTNGLRPHAQVVLEGVDQLTEGAKVEIVPEGGAPAGPPTGRRRGQGRGPGGAPGGPGGGQGGQGAPGAGGPGAPGAAPGQGAPAQGAPGQGAPGQGGQEGGRRRPGGAPGGAPGGDTGQGGGRPPRS
jgi:multidrug efflux system membrane fusion protein